LQDEARAMCERSLAIEPNYTAYSNLGTLAFSNSNFGRAVEMFDKANEIDDSDYYTSMNLGLAHYHMDNERDSRPALQRAVTLIEEQLETAPGDRGLMLDLADCEAVLGNRDRAIELLDLVTQEDRDDPRFLATVGEVYAEAGERELAIQWLTRALDAGLEPAFLRSNPTLRKVQEYRDLADQYETGH
jgi:Flp pilus assembly protein TadD